jgi:signal transduction histidine kinase
MTTASPPPAFPRDERAQVARALHEGVAQTLAALGWELAAALRDCPDEATVARLTIARALAADALEQTRTVGLSVQPPPHGDPLRSHLVAPR